jgi:LacI family transcriptional regulator
MPTAEQPKYLRVSRAIEERIHRGAWANGRVPSVRRVAAEHNVSVVTASRALQALRDKGLITTVDRSGCYLADRRAPAGEKWALVQRITPGPFQKEADDVSRRGFRALAEQQALDWVGDAFVLDGDPTDRDLRRQVRRAQSAGITGVFFMPSRVSDEEMRRDEQFLAACRAGGLPVVLLERNLRGDWRPLELDLVANDDLTGGALATRHLLARGRARVGFVVASPNSSHNARVAGYLAAVTAAARRGAAPAPLVLWEPTDLPKKEAYSRLADRLLEARADGVVCYQDYTAIGLTLEFLARGVRVPRDVAIVGFDDLPLGNQFAIGITTYAFPAEEVARQALRLMRDRIADPSRPPVQVVVPGQLIVRESTGGPEGE